MRPSVCCASRPKSAGTGRSIGSDCARDQGFLVGRWRNTRPFDHFIAQLTRFGFIAPWHFAPGTANVRVGQTFVATNIGGETHTFTEVAEFGGGIVPLLNELAGVPEVAPECKPDVLEADDFVAPGGTYRETIGRAGTVKFQCSIHP